MHSLIISDNFDRALRSLKTNIKFSKKVSAIANYVGCVNGM
ncbi:hypothetical protein [Sphaerospermopsis sp. LEGE 08334]|nr:hypothetical protein [Sphaerospermopsis sp. LEGE 08334]